MRMIAPIGIVRIDPDMIPATIAAPDPSEAIREMISWVSINYLKLIRN